MAAPSLTSWSKRVRSAVSPAILLPAKKESGGDIDDTHDDGALEGKELSREGEGSSVLE